MRGADDGTCRTARSRASRLFADRDEYLGAASEMLMKLFPSDHVVYNILDARSPSARVLSFPEYEDGNLSEAFLSVCDDHPIILSYLGDTTPGLWAPRRLSDLVTDLALYRTRTYRVLLRPYAVSGHEILPIGGQIVPR